MNKSCARCSWRCQALLGWPSITWLQPTPALHLPDGEAVVQGSPRGGAALPTPSEENHPQPKGSPRAVSVGPVGNSELGLAAWLANSEVLAAMETCTSPSLWLKSQTKPQNKRRRVSLFSCRSLGERGRRGRQEVDTQGVAPVAHLTLVPV